MFRRHSNPAQQDSHPARKRSRIRAGVLGASVLGAGVVGTLGAGVASADTPKDTTTVTYKGDPIKPEWSSYMPRLTCPADHPYLLNQQYNTNTAFRLGPGIEYTDWKSGFDVDASGNNYFQSVPTPKGQARIGFVGGEAGVASATYWAWPWDSPTNWTLTLHCTSNLNDAAFQR